MSERPSEADAVEVCKTSRGRVVRPPQRLEVTGEEDENAEDVIDLDDEDDDEDEEEEFEEDEEDRAFIADNDEISYCDSSSEYVPSQSECEESSSSDYTSDSVDWSDYERKKRRRKIKQLKEEKKKKLAHKSDDQKQTKKDKREHNDDCEKSYPVRETETTWPMPPTVIVPNKKIENPSTAYKNRQQIESIHSHSHKK